MNPSQCITDDNKWKWDKWKCPKASEPHSNSTRHLTREPGSVCMAMTGNFEEVMLVPGSQGWSDMALLVVQLVKNVPAMQETWVRFLGWEDPLEKEMATHSSILAWKAQGQRSLQSTGLQEWLNHHHQAKSEQRACSQRATVHGIARMTKPPPPGKEWAKSQTVECSPLWFIYEWVGDRKQQVRSWKVCLHLSPFCSASCLLNSQFPATSKSWRMYKPLKRNKCTWSTWENIAHIIGA